MLVRREQGPVVSWARRVEDRIRAAHQIRRIDWAVFFKRDKGTILIILKMNQIIQKKRRKRALFRACAEAEPVGPIVQLGERFAPAAAPACGGEKEVAGVWLELGKVGEGDASFALGRVIRSGIG